MEIEVTGVLLAGGKSRRMGEDKRYLVVGEETLLERGLGVLRSVFQEVLIVIAQNSPPLGVDAKVARDLVPECGSLGGLYTGLMQAATPWIFVVACDMPFLDQAVIAQFTSRRATVRYCDGETRGPATSDACVIWQTMPAHLGTDDSGTTAQDPRVGIACVASGAVCY